MKRFDKEENNKLKLDKKNQNVMRIRYLMFN